MPDSLETPLQILLWLAVVSVVAPIGFLILAGVGTLIKWELQNRRARRAEGGKVICEAHKNDGSRCNNVATHRTPNGYFCEYDSRQTRNNQRFTSMSSFSYRIPLGHVKRSRDV